MHVLCMGSRRNERKKETKKERTKEKMKASKKEQKKERKNTDSPSVNRFQQCFHETARRGSSDRPHIKMSVRRRAVASL